MEVKLQVRNNVNLAAAKGSLPWLLANMGHIDISKTKAGNIGAWLRDRDGATITILVLQNGEEDDKDGNLSGPIRIAARAKGDEYDNYILATHCTFTDAAWDVIATIQEQMEEEVRRILAGDVAEDDIDVSIVRVRDETARQLARATLEDGAAVPIFHDRLKEIGVME